MHNPNEFYNNFAFSLSPATNHIDRIERRKRKKKLFQIILAKNLFETKRYDLKLLSTENENKLSKNQFIAINQESKL